MSERLRGLHLHVDGASGAAGDMMLGALIDLGVPREVIEQAFDRVGIGGARLVRGQDPYFDCPAPDVHRHNS